jgi:hypothetical protein
MCKALSSIQRELAFTTSYVGHLRVVHDRHSGFVDRGFAALFNGKSREIPQIDHRTTGNTEHRRVEMLVILTLELPVDKHGARGLAMPDRCSDLWGIGAAAFP